MDRIYWSTGQFVLGIYKGSTAIAVYAVAVQLLNMYMLFSTAITGVLLPKITAMVVKGNNEKEISDLFIKVGRIQYIIVVFILSSFIVFGKPFIKLWAGSNYVDSYYVCLFFFIPFTIDLIQNLGISILQARNRLKFRSLLLVFVASSSLLLSVVLAKKYGYYGCAFSTGLGLLIGQGLILNIYYCCKEHIDIPSFWKEILKMSVVPFFVIIIGLLVTNSSLFNNISLFAFVVSCVFFLIVYGVAFWFLSMNKSERDLVIRPFMKLLNR